MDAQNANEATSTKPAASSATSSPSSRPGTTSDRQKASMSASASSLIKSPISSRDVPPSTKPHLSTDTSALARDRSSKGSSGPSGASPPASRDAKVSSTTYDKRDDESGGTDGSSEAETIVMSQDGSPVKQRKRKAIKQEDKTNGNSATTSAPYRAGSDQTNSKRPVERKGALLDKQEKAPSEPTSHAATAALQQKKKRLQEKEKTAQQSAHHPLNTRPKDASSSLSSVPTSPPRSRQPSAYPYSGSDSEHRTVSPKHASSMIYPPERLIPNKRKVARIESDDEAESRKARRLRLTAGVVNGDASSSGTPNKTASKDVLRHTVNGPSNGNGTKSAASRTNRETSHNRSQSPPLRSHRRSASTQLQSQSNGSVLNKRPTPLTSADYNSDDSSASGSHYVRSAKLRSLATPAPAEPSVSPAKAGPHRKHLDAHGQTPLAKACAKGEYETVKLRLKERPEDLDHADFAGNTPLQIAALNGYGDIVKLLVDAGCNLDCVNYDKDTPLLDAVDNGHLQVVRLLLDAGVNPRKANVNGEEPYDRVDDDVDNAEEIRAALIEAKKRIGERRFASEEHRHDEDSRSLHGPESPRRSPAPANMSSRRTGTVRANKTSNHLLYMPMDDKTLRQAAGRGDEETVIRILQVRETFNDPESMVAAARGGHDVVMQLLLALGKASPDPPPISTAPPEHATPILAAIGQENIKVVNLLLEQTSFNPTQRFNGDTYYEIARKRAGPNWKEEEDVLKKAYDNYKKTHGSKSRSPLRKDSESRRASRITEAREDASLRVHKRKLSSPSQERPRKGTPSKLSTATSGASRQTSPKEERVVQKRAADHSPKRSSSNSVPVKNKQRDDRSVTSNLDRDTPPPSKLASKSKKNDLESAAGTSESETVKPRRKLVSGRELKDEKEREKERERQRRASLAASSSKGSSSPHEPRHDDILSDKARAEKHRTHDRDRTRQIKEEFKDSTPGFAAERSTKRHRMSETPTVPGSLDKDLSDVPTMKKRRLDGDTTASSSCNYKEKKAAKPSTSPDASTSKSSTTTSRDSLATNARLSQKRRESDEARGQAVSKAKKRDVSADRIRRDPAKATTSSSERIIHVKSEDVDVEMPDVGLGVRSALTASNNAFENTQKDGASKKMADAQIGADTQSKNKAVEAKKKAAEQQRRQQEEEEMRTVEEEAKRKRELEKKKAEEQLKERKRLEEAEKERIEEVRKRKGQEERKRREEEERKRQEDAERRRQEEEERKRQEEEERKRQEEEERKRQEEEERKRQEEEQKRREQRKKEAAEEARRKHEEVERKERERQEQERKEQDRIRAAKEAEEAQRRKREEVERIRVASLPPVLRWLSLCPNPKQANVAKAFRTMQGIRYDCINTSATGSPEGREQWVMNTQVALVFGEKDLTLSRYSSWKRLPVSMIAKRIIWRLESDRYALTDDALFDFGKQLPGFYGADGPEAMTYQVPEKLRREAWEKFSSLDMFFVKVADVMKTVPYIPHLRDVRLTVVYRELPEHESQLATFATTQKWKSDPDPDRFHGFAPRNKYYVNGQMVLEEKPGFSEVSKTPFPEVRVPRRGFVAVLVGDPDFVRLCKEQGIDPAAFQPKMRSPNGVPNGCPNGIPKGIPNGLLDSVINGVPNSVPTGVPLSPTSATVKANGNAGSHLVNGVNDARNG